MLKEGFDFWQKILIFASLGFYYISLLLSLSGQFQHGLEGHFSLLAYVSGYELLGLLLLGPLFFSRFGASLAFILCIYAVERIYLGNHRLQPSSYYLIFSLAYLSVSLTRAPWRSLPFHTSVDHHLADFIGLGLSIAFLGLSINFLFQENVDLTSSQRLFCCLVIPCSLACVFDKKSRFLLLFCAYPSLVMLVYTTGLPAIVALIPFAWSISLAMSSKTHIRAGYL